MRILRSSNGTGHAARCVVCSSPLGPARWAIEGLPVVVASTADLDRSKDAFVDVFVRVCASCGVIQTSKDLDTSIYETPQFFAVGGVWAAYRRFLAEFIDRCLPSGAARVGVALEIGPAATPILRSVSRPIDRAFYFDLMSKLPFELQAHERYRRQSFPPPDSVGEFDLIVASHVIEHAPNTLEFLAAVKRNLSPRGVGVLSLPNFGEWFGKSYWNAISCEHLSYPFAGQLAAACRRVGLHVEFTFFGGHSVFMKVSKEDPTGSTLLPPEPTVQDIARTLDEWVTQIQRAMHVYEEAIRGTEGELLLVGASHLAQYVGLMSPAIGARTRYVLDNAIAKHGKRLYGTPFLVKPFDHLQECANPVVIVPPSPYAVEMKAQILSLNPTTRVIT